ncbi:MAG: polymer-forming cytoskeletal protein [Candidatus Pacebacteria bacterium]|nr:polymer-forming cytoskeletal protein [Candidatus Paceibacterota bacterium]
MLRYNNIIINFILKNDMRNIKSFLIPILAIMVLIPMLSFGAFMKVGESVSIRKGDDIKDNLYVAGGNVSINSIIFGDLLTAGGNVLITENVSDDMAVVGGAVKILGNSGGDMRVVGGDILIAGNVAGELIVTGGSVVVSSDVMVGDDLIIAGGQIAIDGDVMGDAQIAGGIITINGHIKGDVKIKIDEKLIIGDGAIIDGNLEYSAKSSEVLKMSEGAVITGETIFKEIGIAGIEMEGIKNFIFAIIGVFVLFKLLAFILTAFLFVWLFKRFSNSVLQSVVKNPFKMLGKGFVALIIIPAASILLFITLFGIPLGIMTIFTYILLLFVACMYSGIITGAWLSKIMHKSDRAVITYKNIIGGFVLLVAIRFIPFIGWILGLFIFLVTLGSLVDVVHRKLWNDR